MAEVVRYTPQELQKIDEDFRYTIYGQGLTIYLADSSVARRRTLLNDLKKAGYEMVFDASKVLDLQQALLKCTTPKMCIMLDLGIPRLNPSEFVSLTLKKYPDCIILLTHDNEKKEVIAKAIKSGAAGVMPRPFTSEDVINKLTSLGLHI